LQRQELPDWSLRDESELGELPPDRLELEMLERELMEDEGLALYLLYNDACSSESASSSTGDMV